MKHAQEWVAWSPQLTNKKKWTIEESPSPMMEWIPVAMIHGKGEVAETNANLIASAPELLEEIKDVQKWILDFRSNVSIENAIKISNRSIRITDLIAKAEGKS